MTTGRCFGSVKMVMQFYDLMVLGGVPSTDPLSFGAHFGVLLLVRHEWQGGVDISGNSGLGNENNEYDSDDSLTNSNSLGNNVAYIRAGF